MVAAVATSALHLQMRSAERDLLLHASPSERSRCCRPLLALIAMVSVPGWPFNASWCDLTTHIRARRGVTALPHLGTGACPAAAASAVVRLAASAFPPRRERSSTQAGCWPEATGRTSMARPWRAGPSCCSSTALAMVMTLLLVSVVAAARPVRCAARMHAGAQFCGT